VDVCEIMCVCVQARRRLNNRSVFVCGRKRVCGRV